MTTFEVRGIVTTNDDTGRHVDIQYRTTEGFIYFSARLPDGQPPTEKNITRAIQAAAGLPDSKVLYAAHVKREAEPGLQA